LVYQGTALSCLFVVIAVPRFINLGAFWLIPVNTSGRNTNGLFSGSQVCLHIWRVDSVPVFYSEDTNVLLFAGEVSSVQS